MINANLRSELITALEWYIDQGVSDVVLDDIYDRTIVSDVPTITPPTNSELSLDTSSLIDQGGRSAQQLSETNPIFLGKSDARKEAVKLALLANNLDELSDIIQNFDGIAIKKTASNMVFSSGNPKADIMLVGDAPADDEDRSGTPFDGAQGLLLDKILSSIGLSVKSSANIDINNMVYLSNVLNWRPPGNRTPNISEIEVSLPFIERHIQLVRPKILILCGTIAAKSLLGRSEGLSRLRKNWHNYTVQTQEMKSDMVIPALVTYPPSLLLKNPLQKKSVWIDMLSLQEKIIALKK